MNVLYSPLRKNNSTVSAAGESETVAKVNKVEVMPNRNTTAPIALTEIDDDLDDRETVHTPYPGVDDGFFPDTRSKDHPVIDHLNPEHPKPPRPDVEVIPSKPKQPEPVDPPGLTPRNGFGGARDPDDIDGKPNDPNRPLNPPLRPNFPYAPGYGVPFGHDWEIGSLPDLDSIPDVNVYQHKKTLAQGMMDLALFSANANQLRYVLESFKRHPYYFPSLALISISLILQVAVGIGLIWNAAYNVKDKKEICKANKINNFTVIGIFLVTVINVFISAFGVANPP